MNTFLEQLREEARKPTPKDKATGLPKRYVEGLTPQQKKKQVEEIEKSKEIYKTTGKVETREKVGGRQRKSPHTQKFMKKYGFPITDLQKVKAEFPNTQIDVILKKGRGAYASSGSRPNQTPESWAYARLASVLTGGKAMAVDKDLIGKADFKKILS